MAFTLLCTRVACPFPHQHCFSAKLSEMFAMAFVTSKDAVQPHFFKLSALSQVCQDAPAILTI